MTHKFKVGDVVVRHPDAEPSLGWNAYVTNCSPKELVVTKISDSGLYIQINSWHRSPDGCPFSSLNFVLKDTPVQHVRQQADVVKAPSHYQFFPGVEAIEIIAASLTEEGFHGYCMGNRLKYRLRAGNKDKLEQDISKSDFYVELFNKHKHLCREA